MTEIWKPVVGYEGFYAVSDMGRVKRTVDGRGSFSGRPVRGHLKRTKKVPRHYTTLRREGKRAIFFTHRLVALAFLGPAPTPEHEVNHRDGNPSNNAVSNLEWATRSENARHACATGLRRAPGTKLTENDVREIRTRCANGESRAGLGREFGITPSTAERIVARKLWRSVV